MLASKSNRNVLVTNFFYDLINECVRTMFLCLFMEFIKNSCISYHLFENSSISLEISFDPGRARERGREKKTLISPRCVSRCPRRKAEKS